MKRPATGLPERAPASPHRPLSSAGVTAACRLAAVLLAFVPVAGCGSDDEKDSSSKGALRTLPSVATIEAPAPTGATIEGTGYAFKLAGEWSDVTDQARAAGVDLPGLELVVAAPRRGAPGATNVNVVRLPNPTKITLERLVASYRADHETSGKIGVSEAIEIDVGGERGLSYTYRTKSPEGSPLRDRQVVVVREGQAYVITLATGPPQFRDGNRDLLSMLSSWRWT